MQINFKKIFNDFFIDLTALLPNVITAILILVCAIIIGRYAYKLLSIATDKRWKDKIVSNFLSQGLKWTIYLFGVISALSVLGFTNIAGTVFAGAGVSAIVIGFAFKDIGENFLAGIIIALKPPFEIGDLIEVQGDKGIVQDLDLRMTHLRNSEGKDIYIPNASILKNPLTNYTKDGFLRINFVFGIAPECDIEFARKLVLDYLKGNGEILEDPEYKVVVQGLGEFTTDIQVLFWIDILSKKSLPDAYLGHNIRSKVITDVKTILDKNNIEMPSQVLEHKMYRTQKIAFEKINND